MARKKVNYYKFTPGAAGVGTVKVMDNYDLGDFLMITNVTRNIVIYNFGDPNRGGAVSFDGGTDNQTFSAEPGVAHSVYNGVTTLTLDFDTSTHSAGDVLQIYVETIELRVRTHDFGIDAVERQRVGIPRSLIDADFEYGLQTTKWATFFTYRQSPTTFAMDGTDFSVNAFSYATLISTDAAFTATAPGLNTTWNMSIMNQGNITTVASTVNVLPSPTAGNSSAPFPGQYLVSSAPVHYNNDYKLIISQVPGSTGANATPTGSPGPATNISTARPITLANGGQFQRTFSVFSTEHFQINDVIIAVGLPNTPGAFDFAIGTVLSSGTGSITTNTYTTSASLLANTTIAFEVGGLGTNQFELMNVTVAPSAAGATASLVLHGTRQLLGTNASNTTVSTGGRIYSLQPGAATVNTVVQGGGAVNAVELMKVDAIDRVRNELTVTRGWFGTNANVTFGAGTIIGIVNLRPFNTYDQWLANVEIVKTDLSNAGSTGFNSLTAQQIAAPTNPSTIGAQTNGTFLGVRRNHIAPDYPVPSLGVPARTAGFRPGSIVLTLSGMFNAGNTTHPLVGVNANVSGIQRFSTANVGNSFISTIGTTGSNQNANVEGVFMNTLSDNTYMAFAPKFHDATKYPGYPLIPPTEQATIAPRFKRGGLFQAANLIHNAGNVTIVSNAGATSNIVIRTQNPHGIVPGTPIQVSLGGTAGAAVNGSGVFVVTHANLYYFSYLSKTVATGSAVAAGTLSANVIPFPTALVKHRPLDGGTNIGINAPCYGFEATRQTRKYFRYQSGKGMMFTTGTQFNPVFSVANIQANSATLTAGGSNGINISTVVEHGIQRGANVKIYGLRSTGYNDYYNVDRVTGPFSFVVKIKNTLETRYPTVTGGNVADATYNPRVTVTNWYGAKVRGGMFDDGNGVFWEYDGQYLWAVKRSATYELIGTISIANGDNRVTGDSNTRFADNLTAGDQIQIRGIVHDVVSVESQNVMYVTPSYRGVTNAVNIPLSVVKEVRTRSANFNLDRLDGTGPSGYIVDLSKMQMVGIQYTWYGAGFVDWGMRATDGQMIWAHRMKNNNRNDEGYMRSGNLPARYQAANRGAYSQLTVELTATETANISVAEIDEFPAASTDYPSIIMVNNELISYTTKHTFTHIAGNTQGNLGGLTRAVEYTPFILGAARSLRGEAASTHSVHSPVLQFTATASPDLNHWGSAVILDGDFDVDRTYSFTYAVNSAWVSAAQGQPQTLFMIRLAPSLGSGIPGDLGARDLLNRAQLLLQNCYINFDGTANRAILQGIVNPTNIDFANWQNINQAANQFAPSFTQFVSNISPTLGNVTGGPNGHNTNIRWSPVQNPNPPITGFASGTGTVVLPFAFGGEQLFSIPVSGTNSGFIDLSRVKEVGGAIFPGNQMYPNGPEVIAFNIIPLIKNGTPSATASFVGDFRVDLQLTWIESQA